jgi:hypothetical protein
LNNDLEKIWKEAAVALTVPANLFDSWEPRRGDPLTGRLERRANKQTSTAKTTTLRNIMQCLRCILCFNSEEGVFFWTR